MNGLQIDSLLRNLNTIKRWYHGTFTEASIPFNLIEKNNIFFIVNTVSNVAIMGHWVLIFINKNVLYYFDSYGNLPPDNNIMKFIKTFPRKRYLINVKSLQSNNSFVCGAYCIYLAYFKCKGISFPSILARFSRNKRNNDKKVLRFLFKLIDNKCVGNFCPRLMFNESCNDYLCMCHE